MPKLPRVHAKKVFILLHKFGYKEIACNGSHYHFKVPGTGKSKITVPYHPNDELKVRTLKIIIKILSKNEKVSEKDIIEILRDL